MITDNQVTTANHGFAAMAEASANAKAGPAGSAGALSGFEAATPLMVAPYHIGAAQHQGATERDYDVVATAEAITTTVVGLAGAAGVPFGFGAATAVTSL